MIICELLINKKLIQLTEDCYTIGRSPLCSIVIVEKTLSRIHCTLAKGETTYQIADGNLETGRPSANGTRINGIRVNSDYGQELKHGDTIELSALTKIEFFSKQANEIDVDSTLL